ncbi:hypothetical protein [Cellulomonas sp. FA1]|uniref:hypothetical protein n=1 Tax=Cellulomonas sp. FA1 TaxID=1346710 RepID=UPI00069BE533|nr:hypothetical protein [Cellulomonas sp. FA1]
MRTADAATVDLLLAGPRGRTVCWEVVADAVPAARAAVRAAAADPAGTRHVVDALRSAGDVAPTPADVSRALDLAVAGARYWQPPDEQDAVLADPRVVAALEPVARAVLAAPSAAWWSQPCTTAAQVLTAYDDAAPARGEGVLDALDAWRARVVAEERAAGGRRRPVSGSWWSTPAFAGLTRTTRRLPDGTAPGFDLVEDGDGWDAVTAYAVDVPAGARVLELTVPEDVAALVADHPLEVTASRQRDWYEATGRSGRWLVPDHRAIADAYDGVHVTVLAWAAAAGRALSVGDGTATVLAGWDPDATYWYTDDVTICTPGRRWCRDDARWRRDVAR